VGDQVKLRLVNEMDCPSRAYRSGGGRGLQVAFNIGVPLPAPSMPTRLRSFSLSRRRTTFIQLAHDTALSDLWNAYDDELAGVLMPTFGELRRSVSCGNARPSRAAAIAALEADLEIARGHDSTHDERLLAEWIRRLAASD
jgi:hypothetical protein